MQVFEETYPDRPVRPLFFPVTIALVATGVALHLPWVAYRSDRPARTRRWLAAAAPPLVALPLLPYGWGARRLQRNRRQPRLRPSLVPVVRHPDPRHGGHLRAPPGAERWPALTAPIVIAVTLAGCFVLEAVLSVIGLFTLCGRHSWTLLIVQVVLTLAVPLGGAIAASARTWA